MPAFAGKERMARYQPVWRQGQVLRSGTEPDMAECRRRCFSEQQSGPPHHPAEYAGPTLWAAGRCAGARARPLFRVKRGPYQQPSARVQGLPRGTARGLKQDGGSHGSGMRGRGFCNP
ncbi:hypothetical protein [Komagataeibacter saccharivorans]|uniref:hypothetical protein n=1 Tax=Komagataeibacter saccharivorans TaxID=265959 RepID=UPI0024A968A5|nr:hypothetical protein [Komagataeibacter saccharivorans]